MGSSTEMKRAPDPGQLRHASLIVEPEGDRTEFPDIDGLLIFAGLFSRAMARCDASPAAPNRYCGEVAAEETATCPSSERSGPRPAAQ